MTDNPNQASDSTPKPIPISAAQEIPVYSCCVLVRKSEGSGYHARVANLADITVQGSSERDVLQKITTTIKSSLKNWVQSGGTIPWVDPPAEKLESEQERFLAIHL
ncbi:MAG: hypothetical protein COA78_09040 [Blastopirellula sp.]|nr:MAG: hypothetical protein COA78_09040 [Blastopirellula sp.]